MTYEAALHALADPTRRAIFETLRRQPSTVTDLAKTQPVSRPAVSQHLKVLHDAKLVKATPKGSHRIYAVRAEGLDALRRYLDGFWDETLAAFGAEITKRNRNR
jgi:DNA-binding transcriptional ArsR family regulator